MVEEELVRVRGLISIVFDLGHSRVTCRVRRDLPPEKLAAAVARTETLSALQVMTNAKGEEVSYSTCLLNIEKSYSSMITIVVLIFGKKYSYY